MTRTIRAALAALTVLAAFAGCDAGSPSANSSPSVSGMSEQQIVAVIQEYTLCMREHGIPTFEAPRLVDDRVTGGGIPDGLDRASTEQAWEACDPIIRRLPSYLMNDTPSEVGMEKLRQFAACLREHGVPDWPDPDNHGAFPVNGTPMEQILKTDQGQVAVRACDNLYDGRIKVAGNDGGSK